MSHASARGPVVGVDVWVVDLGVGVGDGDAATAAMSDVLSPAERDRAARFRFDRDRRRWAASRASLRVLLSRYTDQPAASLCFRTTEHGKPFVDGGPPFNLSHSGDVALLAVADTDVPLGVDVEQVRGGVEHERIAERFFSETEQRALRALAPEQREDAFFRCWTRKEAVIKAIGEGLSIPLADFDVTLGPREPAQVVACRVPLYTDEPWQLVDVAVRPGYFGAVAIASAAVATTVYDVGATSPTSRRST